jgi:hypothetical protein
MMGTVDATVGLQGERPDNIQVGVAPCVVFTIARMCRKPLA